jgi:hypothetical protein
VAGQATVARIGEGPVLAAILGATAVVGFGIGTWIGSQTPPSAPGGLALASPTMTPSLLATPTPTARSSPTTSPRTSPAAPQGPREIVLEMSGTEHDVSDPFDALPGWQVQWQTDGTSIAIAVTGKQNLGTIVDEEGPASGVTSLAPAGTFQLNIVARGPWSITVIQGEEPAASPT